MNKIFFFYPPQTNQSKSILQRCSTAFFLMMAHTYTQEETQAINTSADDAKKTVIPGCTSRGRTIIEVRLIAHAQARFQESETCEPITVTHPTS